MPPSDNTIRIPYSEVANARERYLELVQNSSRAMGFGHGTTDDEIHELLNAYHIATAVWPAQRDEFHFEVLDEQEKPLNGVQVEVLGFEGVNSRLEPTGTKNRIVVNGEARLRWTNRGPLELYLQKEGYRQINVAIAPHHSADNSRYESAQHMLEDGYLLPPKTPNGPIRIILPPRVDWDPPVISKSDDRPGGRVDPKLIPKTVPPDAPVVVGHKDWALVPAPVRGTYVLADRNGSIRLLVSADRGNLLGIHTIEVPEAHERFVTVTAPRSGGGKLPFEDAPYEWRLYSIAKPRSPTAQP